MASAIDPTKPADGVPAVKSDLRANLKAAKEEIEALQHLVATSLTLGSLISLDAKGGAFTNYRAAQDVVSGGHTFAEVDSGSEKIFIGDQTATWTVPALPAGCHVVVHNLGWAVVEFAAGGVTLKGSTILAPERTAALSWLPGNVVKLTGELS